MSLVKACLYDVKTGQHNADMDAVESEKIFLPFMAWFEYESLFGETFGILELYLIEAGQVSILHEDACEGRR